MKMDITIPEDVLVKLRAYQLILHTKQVEVMALQDAIHALILVSVGVDTSTDDWILDIDTGKMRREISP